MNHFEESTCNISDYLPIPSIVVNKTLVELVFGFLVRAQIDWRPRRASKLKKKSLFSRLAEAMTVQEETNLQLAELEVNSF